MAADTLAVWLGDKEVGTLRRDPRGFTFASSDAARGLTAAAQGAESPWSREFARNWFDNLLPDNAQRQAVADAHGISPTDVFALLGAVGWECAGAVSVLPEARLPASGSYRALTDAELWARLDALPFRLPEDEEHIRMSLGGAQDKLLLHRSATGWDLPLDGAVSTHILKPEPVIYRGLAAAEAMCLEAAAAATPAAQAELLAADGHRPALVVTRFDRTISDGRPVRIHQEDGCQVLGLPPSARFATAQPSPARGSYGAIARVLVRRAQDPSAELRGLLEQMTVNQALGNRDAHAKNYSVLHQGGYVRMAPLYDVSPTRPFMLAAFGQEPRYSAMLVDGRRVFDSITRGSLAREAHAWGVPLAVARTAIAETLERLAAGVSGARERYPSVGAEVRAAIDESLARLAASAW